MFVNEGYRINDEFLKNYLNEFYYKFNRRQIDTTFEKLMIAAVLYRWNYLGERNG